MNFTLLLFILAMTTGMHAMKERDPIFVLAERWIALHKNEFDRKMRRKNAFIIHLEDIAETSETGERYLKRKREPENSETIK